jgi:hypothetical protein
MEGFQKIILFSAIAILILSLIMIGLALSSAKDQQWPPIVPACPDYWLLDGSGNNTQCINVKDLGTCPAAAGKKHLTMNFNNSTFTGSEGTCNKYNWATGCGISWDGITYGVNNPCASSTAPTTTTSS